MKRAVFFIILGLSCLGSSGQPHFIYLQKKAPLVELVKDKPLSKTYTFNFSEIQFIEVATPEGSFNQLLIPGTYRTGEMGEPQTVSAQKLIAIPKGASATIKVQSYNEKEFLLEQYTTKAPLLPYQPSYRKDESAEDQPFIISKAAYAQKSYLQHEMAHMEILGNLRGMQIVKITINPVAYHPTANKIKVFNQVQITVDIKPQKTDQPIEAAQEYSPYFSQVYQYLGLPLNYPENPDLMKQPTRYLLVTPPEFIETLTDFIQWKIQKGFEVIVGNTAIIGATANEIKNWIQLQYADTIHGKTAPIFLLLVGDIQQIPASQTGVKTNKATDLYYASIDGDMFPDMYCGRLPAQDSLQLQGMLNKLIQYETYTFPDDGFLNEVTLIAGADVTWNPRVAQPTINYGTENYFNTLQGYTFIHTYLNTYTDCYATDNVSVGFINYTAHCSQTSWSAPLLTAASVSSFNNNNKYPFVVGNCCTSGDFSINTCIGEAWIRNPNGGAIAYLGSVPDTYWWEDFYWAVGAHAPVYNNYPTTEGSSLGMYDAPFVSNYLTTAGLLFAGNLAVTEAHNENYLSDVDSRYYWEAYHCLGEPSLVPFFTKGKIQTVSHNNRLESGLGEFLIQAQEGSTVALSVKDSLLASTQVDNSGSANLFFPSTFEADSVKLVVTKPQYQPYIRSIPVTISNSAYLAINNLEIDDETENQNGTAEYGETVFLNIGIENIGESNTASVQVQVEISDPYITFDSSKIFQLDYLDAGAQIPVTDFFALNIDGLVPDQHRVDVTIRLSDSLPFENRKYYIYQRFFVVNAPILDILPHLWVDDFYSNANLWADVGESLQLKVGITNSGHAQISTTVVLESILPSPNIQIPAISPISYPLFPGDTLTFSTEILVTNDVEGYDSISISLLNEKFPLQKTIILPIGNDSSIQLGSADQSLADYPFNNYYKNNRTQFLFLKEEIFRGRQLISGMAFNLSAVTSEIGYRDLKNLVIKVLPTSLNQLTGFVDMSGAELLMDSATLVLPSDTGWFHCLFEQPFKMTEPENLLFEINWGTTDNYAPSNQRTKVFGSETSFYSVAWGADDDTYPAPLSGVSKFRPQVSFSFDSIGIFCIEVKSNESVNSTYLLENCTLTLNGEPQTTNSLGRIEWFHTHWPDKITLEANSYGYRDTLVEFLKQTAYLFISLELEKNPTLVFQVKNTMGIPLPDATITMNQYSFTTNNSGICVLQAAKKGEFSNYYITKTGYHTLIDSILPTLSGDTIAVILKDDLTDLSIITLDTKNQPIANTRIWVDGVMQFSDSTGNSIFYDLVPGLHNISIYKQGFIVQTDTAEITSVNRFKPYTLKRNGNLKILVNDGEHPLSNALLNLNSISSFTNSLGFASFNNVVEGSYPITISKLGYYPLTDSIPFLGNDSLLSKSLIPIPDLTFFVTNGKTPLSHVPLQLNETTYTTDSFGLIRVNDFETKNSEFEVIFKGYYPVIGSFGLPEKDSTIVITLVEIPDAKIVVTHQGIGIADVNLCIDTLCHKTDLNGTVLWNDLGIGTFEITLMKQGFETQKQVFNCGITDTTFFIEMTPLPDVLFMVSCQQKPIDSARLVINKDTLMSNIFGHIHVPDLPNGTYPYSLTRNGFSNFSDSLTLNLLDTLVHINLKKLTTIDFTIAFHQKPISKATITLCDTVLLTDSMGHAVFTGLNQGILVYSVEKEGFYTITDSLEVSAETIQQFIWFEPFVYSATFFISDTHGNSLPRATINCASLVIQTDSIGKAIIKPLFSDSIYSYSVQKTGYKGLSGNFAVASENMDFNLMMEQAVFEVTFRVSDQNGLLPGASISFDNKVKVTDTNGEARFEEVLPNGIMEYIIRKTDTHFSDTGFLTVSSDTLIEIPLIEVSIDEKVLTDIILYPNPANNKLQFYTKSDITDIKFKITDLQGNSLMEGTLFNNEIPLNGLQPGMYLLQLYDSNHTLTHRFVKVEK